jgi:arabinofuranan 3-O-arabinosyltransferase
VVVRHDLKPTSADGPITADPDKLDAALNRTAGIRPAGQFGVGTLYRVTEPAGRVSAAARLTGVQGPDADASMAAVAALPDGEVASTDPDHAVDAFVGTAADSGSMAFTLATGGPYRFDRTGPEASYRATVTDGQLTLTDADQVAVDGKPLPPRPAQRVTVSDPAVVGIDVDGMLQPLPADGLTVAAGPGAVVTAYAAAPGEGLTGPFRSAGDCNGSSDARPGDDPLRLAIHAGRVCALAPVRLTGAGAYRIHFQVRNEGRATPRMCFWQDGPADCATLPAPPTGTAWSDYTAVTRLRPDAMSARLYLYGESGDGPGVAEFRNVEVTPLRPVGNATLTPAPAPSATVALPAGRHTVTVTRQASKPSGSPEYGICTYPDQRPLDRYPTNNRMFVQPDGIQVLAATNTLCAQTDTVPVIPGATYRFSAEYLGSYGQSPDICLWLDGASRCADSTALVRSNTWLTTTTLVRPPAGTKSITPLIHSNSSDMVPSRVSYRNVSLNRVTLVSVRATPADRTAPSVHRVDATVVSASEYQASVRGAAGRFILVHPESFAPGWDLSGLPRGWTARHVSVDGYANAWLVDGTGDANLTLTYGPTLWSRAALLVSVLGGAVVILVLGARQALRHRRGRRQMKVVGEST